jgi:hypothetical protein
VSTAVLNTEQVDVASGIAAVAVIAVVGVAACLSRRCVPRGPPR